MKKLLIILSIIFIITIIVISLLYYENYIKNHKLVSNEKFQSHRLGNVIDRWYLNTNIPSLNNFESMYEKDPSKNKESFSKYLMKNLKRYTPELNDHYKNKLKKIGSGFLIYHYEFINICVNDFHINLNKIMIEYDNLHNNILFKKIQDENHCIIHFRLGDYISLGDVINYDHIISTMKDLNIKFTTIEIMDGGKNHNSSLFSSFNGFKNYFTNKEVDKSKKIAKEFYKTLEENFPESKIIQSGKRTVDEDFYRMASAPILITAGGSFAIGAAIASKARIIRTPSCKTLDFPSQGCIENLIVNKDNCDWKTYQYTML